VEDGLDASAADQVIALYERHARKFDADWKRSLFEKPCLIDFWRSCRAGHLSSISVAVPASVLGSRL
jgi:hypothetical protein